MHRNENVIKMAKIFTLAFLCSEMHSSLTQQNAVQNRLKNYSSFTNGTEATQENARHQASIRLGTRDTVFGEGHICSGAIIAPSVVLTAAHCIFNYKKNLPHHPSELRVVMGTLNRYQRTAHTLNYGVTHVYQPKTFDALTLRDNLAIIMLERDIPEQHPTVQPITLNMDLGTNSKVHADGAFKVTSWAVTAKNLPITHLMSLNASKINEQSCLQQYGTHYAKGTFCIELEQRKAEACATDAGAPLLLNNQLLGLASYGVNCVAAPVVYTDVVQHLSWISEKIGSGTNQNSSIWGTLGFLLFTAFVLKTSNFGKIK